MIFIFGFLPISLMLYYACGNKYKDIVLLVLSILFYILCSLHYIYVLFFLGMTVATVVLGRKISSADEKNKKKSLYIIGVFLNASALIFFKYANILVSTIGTITSKDIYLRKILLPVGISFYTFKAISYLMDVYTGKITLEGSSVRDLLYLTFFPQIQSGPITRYGEMKRVQDGGVDFFSSGVYRFICGFCKKIIIADSLANISSEVFGSRLDEASMLYVWLGAVAYSLQLFYDFSGYSDMAIGLSAMFGYKCKENFVYPYMTESVTRFWRRWHISLSEWFRDYVYIPLGGSKSSKRYKVYVNLLIVWLLTGIWHGATLNFIVWGLGYFILISFERITQLPNKIQNKAGKVLYRLFTLLFINFEWVIFNSSDLLSGFKYIKHMITYTSNGFTDSRALLLISNYKVFLIIAVILCFPIVPFLDNYTKEKNKLSLIYNLSKMLVLGVSFLLAISFVIMGNNNPFAYANF